MSLPVAALLFDVGGVLSPDIVELKLRELARAHGHPAEALIAIGRRFRPEADLGRRDEPGYWASVLQEAGVTPRAGDEAFAHYLTADPGMLALARRLRERIPVGILSNDSREMSGERRWRFGFDTLFDPIVISALVGLAKPDLAIYRLAAQRLGLPPERVLFVDDTPANVQGALQAGMQALRFTGRADLERALAAFDLL